MTSQDSIRNLITGLSKARNVIQAGRIDRLTISAVPTGRPVKSGLPAHSPNFAGRQDELSTLLDLLTPDRIEPPGTGPEPEPEPEQTLEELAAARGLEPWSPNRPNDDGSELTWRLSTPDGRFVPVPDNFRMFARRSPSGQLLPLPHVLVEAPGAATPAADGPEPVPDPASVVLVTGPGGVGKTELALQAARRARDRQLFPGGELFVDLQGYRPDRSLQPAQALGVLLVALGVRESDLPTGQPEREQLYRSMLAERAAGGKAVLVLLDNAASVGQVGPLLPGDGRTRVLVTSRNSFALPGAQVLELTALDRQTALEMLKLTVRTLLGRCDSRFERDPVAAEQLSSFCQHLPRALVMVGALIAQDEELSLGQLVAELADFRTRLDDIADDQETLRTVIELSYRHLPEDQARLLRLLALPGFPVSTADAAALNGSSENATRRLLRALVKAHLVEGSGHQEGRWQLPRLTHLFLHGLAAEGTDHQEALTRLVLRQVRHLHGAVLDLTATAPRAGRPVPVLRATALQWLDDHWPAAALLAIGAGPPDLRMQLCRDLATYFERRHLPEDALLIAHVAVLTARQLPTAGPAPEVAEQVQSGRLLRDALNGLGHALISCHRPAEAVGCFEEAAALSRADLDAFGEARALSHLGQALSDLERDDDALTAQRQAVSLLTGPEHADALATARLRLGHSLRAAGQPEQALEEFRALLPQSHQDVQAEAERGVADALLELDRPGEAVTALRAALHRYEALENVLAMTTTRLRLGKALIAAGESAEAVAVLKIVELSAAMNADHWLTARAWLQLGRAFHRLEQPDRAKELLDHSAALAVQEGDAALLVDLGHAYQYGGQGLAEAVDVWMNAAVCLAAVGDLPKARSVLTQLADGLAEGEVDPELQALIPELREAERLLGEP
ncbi:MULTISPECIES: tetratricopeptide repeat protein [unclassified Kitasatospora]|uniref:tetratricopeptide repeat protein n=1 Tax=unclassified Kitasatospora TaxID=2633591 RepID=UPI000A9849FE|nr:MULTISPECIES: tetratricopeptide repeat protein [unclassified Kitasatospora]